MQQAQVSKKRLVFTVTNDLSYDQRMIRICTSLANAGYSVTLTGRKLPYSIPLDKKLYGQKRLTCYFNKGKAFYIEYNIRLFFYLLFIKTDLICAIDLDTILPCYVVSKIRNLKRVYDAHELFCEMKEIVSRPRVYKIWKSIEKFTVPHFKYGYTVNTPIRNVFQELYNVNYKVIMNVPSLEKFPAVQEQQQYILYQGTVNEGRSFETLIPAFQYINYPLWIYGDGNFYNQAVELIKKYNLQGNVILKGKLPPAELKNITRNALLGITLFENNGMSNYLSLANRFFDFMHAGLPQLCVDYPAYREINNEFEIAVLIDNLSSANIASCINALVADKNKLNRLKENCFKASMVYNWQHEEVRLVQFYNEIFI
jgi:glycosyltransferase involved in cell wall biosynthesis